MLATISINTKGNAIDIAPDCIADRAYEPPPIRSTEASNPCTKAQRTLCDRFAESLPPDEIVLMTSEPESDEVTKNKTNILRAKILEKIGKIRLSNI